MKCKNCGSNYPTRELRCPYCGTENKKGVLWAMRREQAEADYRAAEAEVRRKLPIEIADGVANRLLAVTGGLLALFLAVTLLLAVFSGGFRQLSNKLHREALEAQMAALFAEERFGELNALMDEKELSGQDYYAYTQICLLHFDFDHMLQARADFLQAVDSGEMLDDWHMRYFIARMVNRASSILTLDIPAYPELAPENRAVYQRYCAEAEALCRALLGMTEEETAALRGEGFLLAKEGPETVEAIDPDSYLWGWPSYLTDDMPLMDAVIAREAWK